MTTKLDTKVLDKLVADVMAQSRNTYVVHDGVLHGAFVEFGTEFMPARPSFQPALEQNIKNLPDILRSISKDTLEVDRAFRLLSTNIVKDWKDDVPVLSGAYKGSITFSVER